MKITLDAFDVGQVFVSYGSNQKETSFANFRTRADRHRVKHCFACSVFHWQFGRAVYDLKQISKVRIVLPLFRWFFHSRRVNQGS